MPTVKKNFNARRTLHKAIDTVRALNKLKEGGGLMGHMDGAMSIDPKPKPENVDGSKVINDQGQPMEGAARGGSGQIDHDAMEIDSRGNARGQTEDQIRRQEKKIRDTVAGLWSKNRT